MWKVGDFKKNFPIFKKYPFLVYLDSAATSLKPDSVIKKIRECYEHYSANIHRGIYQISEKATKEYEETRKKVAEFIGASPSEIVFTKNTTEAINIVAFGLAEKFLKKGDEVLISIAEHHSNFVPWQVIAKRKKLNLKVLEINNQGLLDIDDIEKKINKKTKIVSLFFVSNVLGTINPIKEISQIIKGKNKNTLFLVDGAQAVPHFEIRVKNLGCDFLAFSGHKMLGPFGVGILWGKKKLLKKFLPLNFGGGMIEEVKIKNVKFQDIPWRFEAGTPDIASVISFKEAISYLEKIGMKNIEKHSQELTNFAYQILKEQFKAKIKIYGPEEPKHRSGLISFNFKNLHPHDISQILDRYQICVRAGHHCAMPLHRSLKISASLRASFYIYNDKKDVEKLIWGLRRVEKILR